MGSKQNVVSIFLKQNFGIFACVKFQILILIWREKSKFSQFPVKWEFWFLTHSSSEEHPYLILLP